jgi:hypothetical protein
MGGGLVGDTELCRTVKVFNFSGPSGEGVGAMPSDVI